MSRHADASVLAAIRAACSWCEGRGVVSADRVPCPRCAATLEHRACRICGAHGGEPCVDPGAFTTGDEQ